ncbi:MAG: phosphate ABC transporter permease PstA [Eubacteriaceae bacterium]|nr:phosphate ABC transporter permease PstA [Eubacteriaceae bacterium]
MSKQIKSKLYFGGIWLVAAVTLAALIIIIGFILVKGVPHITWTFLSEEPSMMGKEGGILSVIVGTLYVTAVAVIIATPIGVAGAVYFTEYAKEGRIIKVIRFFTEVLAGIPSIIFGLFGFAFFVVFLGMGWSIIACGLTLAIMILPTIIRSTEEALKTVPLAYREGSLSMGATKWYTILKVVLPCCRNGILTGVILGLGRAIGETAAVMLTVGGALNMPVSVMDSTRTMALHLYTLASEGLSDNKTYATAALLIIIVLIINTAANAIGRKAMKTE